MKKLLIMIVGPSGSGKSTLEKNLVTYAGDRYYKAISATTRDIRVNDGEKDGIHYFFKQNAGENRGLPTFDPSEMIEHVEFAGNNYGVPLNQIIRDDEKDTVFVVEPNGVLQITEYIKLNYADSIIPLVIYLDIPMKIRVENMVKTRGDDPKVCEERLAKDKIEEDFKNFGLEADLRIKKLDKNLHIHTHEWISLYKRMYVF